MSSSSENPRLPIHAPHGTELSALSWQTEAPLRMLMNNLDPENAERPEDLVVYGGTGKAARSWEAYDALVRTLRTLKDDETMLVQSGKPVGVMRTHEWAPRVLIANSNLVGDWANWEEFRRLEDLGLTMYGQMTAGFVDLHRHPGDPAGHLRDVRRGGRQAVRRDPGRDHHPDRRPRRHGRRPAARRDDERRRRDLRRRRPVADHPADRAPLPRRTGLVRGGGGGAGCCCARRAASALDRAAGQRRPRLPRAAGVGGTHRHRHRPDLRARPAVVPAGRGRLRGVALLRAAATRRASPRRRRPRWPRTCGRWWSSRTRAPRSSTTATRSATRPARVGTTAPSSSPASCRRTSGRCSARARGPSAGPRSPVTRPTSRRPTARSSSCSPTTSGCTSGSPWPARRSRSRGCPRASAGSGTASATSPGSSSTRWSRPVS